MRYGIGAATSWRRGCAVGVLALFAWTLWTFVAFERSTGARSVANLETCPFTMPPVKATRSSAFRYDVGVLAIFKGEARYLAEWLDYHTLIGVQHFWLATNDCEDEAPANASLAPYIAAGRVTLIRTYVCARGFQREAYNRVANELNQNNEVEW